MTTKKILSTLLLASACLLAQPTIRDVRSAAGNLNPGLPGYGIARGSLISIAGSLMGDPQTATFPLSANLNGVSVKIAVGGQEVDALMVSTTASRILAIVPSQTPTGTGTVRVTDGSGTTSVDVTIVDRNFGIFVQKAAAGNVGAAYAMNLSAGGNVWNSLTTPAMPGQQIAILGSGAGATTQDETNAVNAEMLAGDFKLYIGGKLATIASMGRSGLGIDSLNLPAGLAGVDSIVAVVPAGLSGCRVSVVAVTDSARTSNFAAISVSPDGTTCSDPGYLTSNDINGLPASGTYNIGAISMFRFSVSLVTPIGNIDLNTDGAAASFSRIDVGDYRNSSGGSFTSIGSCIVTFSTPDGSDLDNVIVPTMLDAGPAINLKGPAGITVMKKNADGGYAAATAIGSNSPLFPSQGTPFVEAGAFTADNGAGGVDVQGFVANLINPKPFTWTNQAQINDVTRSQGVTLTWSGGSSDANVLISGGSAGSSKTAATFTCVAPASAGSFQVPPAVTLALPATAISGNGLDVGGGSLLVLSSTYSRFTGPGLDQGVFASGGGSLKTLNYK